MVSSISSGGRLSTPISARASPVAMISSHSSTLRSWRTLPGQLADWNRASASADSLRTGRPDASAARTMKYSVSIGMSARRSESGGTGDRHDVQAIVEVLAEAAGGDLRQQVPVARGDHAHVDLDRPLRRRAA